MVAADVAFSRTMFPVLETHPEKRKPVSGLADIVTVEDALNQLGPEGAVVPAPAGDTPTATEYWWA